MKRLALALLATTILAAGASAADMRPAYRAPAPVAEPYSNWSGFYLGLSAGGRGVKSDWDTTAVDAPFGVGGTGRPDPATRSATFDKSAGRFGVYGGVNYQFSNFVAGIEGDIGWANNESSIAG